MKTMNRGNLLLTVAILVILAAITLFAPVSHGQSSVAARVAAWEAPTPTLAQIVQATMRVFISEGGFASTADENGIYRVFRERPGRRRDLPRRQMQAIAAYSNRTFPVGSPFVPPGLTARTRRQTWVSQVTLACSRPANWDWASPDVDWDEPRGQRPSYEELCHALRKRTWRLWQGKTENWCVGRVDHWGGAMDVDNPRKGGWVRVQCDDPAMIEQCDAARASGEKHFNWPVGCARNLFWCDPGRGACSPGEQLASL